MSITENNFKNTKSQKKYIFFVILFILINIYFFKIKIITPTIHAYVSSLKEKNNIHHSNSIIINIYNAMGNITFQLTADYIKYFPVKNIYWIKHPKITIFNNKNTTTWTIECNEAELYNKKKINLYGYVYINRIIKNIYTQSIITNQIFIDLINQDMISEKKTIIHGLYFYSIGSKMYTKLNTNKIKLFEKIYTQYEIKNFLSL